MSLVLCPSEVAAAGTGIEGLEKDFLDVLVDLYPVRATLVGLHEGDGALGPAGEDGARRVRETWSAFAETLAAASDTALSPDDRFDLALMFHELKLRLFELDSLRVGERDPELPLGNLSGGIHGLLARDYAPLEVRAASLIDRLNEAPAYLHAAFAGLGNPPRVLVERALSRADALGILLRDEVPASTSDLADTALAAELTAASMTALQAVWRYREELVVSVLPRSTDAFALGDTLFSQYLHAAEGIDTPLPQLRQKADAEIARLEAEFRDTSARIDSTRAPGKVLYRLSLDHPSADSLLRVVEDAVTEARDFVAADGAFPDLGPVAIEVRATPGVSAWTNASLAAPGPFEAPGFPSVFYVTLPDPLAPKREQEERLRFMSRALLRNLAVHETFPGHGLQAEALRHVGRPVRRAVWSSAFVEGWAHYAEQLMMERGFRAGDDAFALITLQSALRRAARLRVALGLHTEGWTIDEAAAFFAEHSFLEPSMAMQEAERGAVDPLYLVYTLGRMELLALREEVRRSEGDAFDLRRFHQRVLELGTPPLPLIRARLLTPEGISPRFLD